MKSFKLITVDGPAGSGKGTISKALCEKFHLQHVDSGLFYRALAQKANAKQISYNDVENLCSLLHHLSKDDLTDPLLRHESIGTMASKVAVHSVIREEIKKILHTLYNEAYHQHLGYCGIIFDGRDMGTVVFPHAHCKLFITAHHVERAKRRHQQQHVDNERDVLHISKSLKERDNRDSNRKDAPLIPANDAFTLDTTDLTIEQSIQKAIECVQKHMDTIPLPLQNHHTC